MLSVLAILGGLALLIAGGELLVRGAVRVAARLGVSPLVIGLTLVGFGTSTPELVTSVQGALGGYPGIAYGNIVGSNIANILLILGISALLAPILVTSRALRRDTAVMLGVAIAFAGLAALMPLGRASGLVFLAALEGYLLLAFRQERAHARAEHGAAFDKAAAAQEADPAFLPQPDAHRPLWVPLLTGAAGLGLVVLGADFLVDGAVALARAVGISETVIGLTIVAVGTAAPELVTSIMAAVRKHADVAFGNIVGSNIYNILGTGGVTALIVPTAVPPEIVRFDNIVMVAVSVLLVGFAITGMRISRREGGLFVAGYAGYVYWLRP